jgi:hypothetical protein
MFKVLQFSWVLTALISFGIAVFNLVEGKTFTQAVVMPFFVGILCLILFFAMKEQEKSKGKSEDKKSDKL